MVGDQGAKDRWQATKEGDWGAVAKAEEESPVEVEEAHKNQYLDEVVGNDLVGGRGLGPNHWQRQREENVAVVSVV
jgi:hypothetical protein